MMISLKTINFLQFSIENGISSPYLVYTTQYVAVSL